MAGKRKAYLKKHRELTMYLTFGIGTMVVNYFVFWAFHRLLGEEMVEFNNAMSFIAAVTFAYITNKIYVFRSRDWSPRFLAKEIAVFVSARLASFGLEELGLMICVRIFHVGRFSLLGVDGTMISKVVLSFAVVIVNYFISKYLVFRKKQ